MNNKEYGIVETINFSRFCDSFAETYKDNFSYNGKHSLFEHLDQLANDLEQNIELDPIAFCCEYSEYDSAYEAMQQYQPEDMPIEGKDGDDLVEIQEKNEAKALEWLQEHTTVIEVDGGHVIIQDF